MLCHSRLARRTRPREHAWSSGVRKCPTSANHMSLGFLNSAHAARNARGASPDSNRSDVGSNGGRGGRCAGARGPRSPMPKAKSVGGPLCSGGRTQLSVLYKEKRSFSRRRAWPLLRQFARYFSRWLPQSWTHRGTQSRPEVPTSSGTGSPSRQTSRSSAQAVADEAGAARAVIAERPWSNSGRSPSCRASINATARAAMSVALTRQGESSIVCALGGRATL